MLTYVWATAAAVQFVTLKTPLLQANKKSLCQITELSGSVKQRGWHQSSRCQLPKLRDEMSALSADPEDIQLHGDSRVDAWGLKLMNVTSNNI